MGVISFSGGGVPLRVILPLTSAAKTDCAAVPSNATEASVEYVVRWICRYSGNKVARTLTPDFGEASDFVKVFTSAGSSTNYPSFYSVAGLFDSPDLPDQFGHLDRRPSRFRSAIQPWIQAASGGLLR